MKIAFLSHFYPPTHNSGIEQNTHSIARSLVTNGHQVRVLCCDTWAEGETYFQSITEDDWEGVKVRRLNVNWTKAPHPNEYLYDNPLLAEHIRDFLREFEPDVVHVTSMYCLSTRAVTVPKELGLPVVHTLSDFWSICPRHTLMRYDGTICDGQVSAETCQNCMMSESRLYRKAQQILPNALLAPMVNQVLQKPDLSSHIPGMRGWGINVDARRHAIQEALEQVDYLVTPSDYVRRTIVATGRPLKINVSNYGNDLSWLDDYQLRQPDETIHIGYLGQVTPIKGVDLLLESFLAANFGEKAQLYIYGKLDEQSPYVQKLRAQAGTAANVHFMGKYLRSDLPKVLGNLDIIAVPSVWPEVAGLVVQEAFAAQLPVIATELGGLPEFVQQGKGGLPFDYQKKDTLTAILRQVVDGGHEYLDKLRRDIPPVRTTEAEVEYLTNIYQQLIAQRASGVSTSA